MEKIFGEVEQGAPEVHCEIGPSSLEQVFLCPGSHNLQKLCPVPETSEIAKTGSDFHAVLSNIIRSHRNEDLTLDFDKFPPTDLSKPGICIDRLKKLYKGGKVRTEVLMPLLDKNGNEVLFGTSDVVIEDEDSVTIIDWKFGYREVTDPKHNLQLAAYAAMAADLYGKASATAYVVSPNFTQKEGYTFSKGELDQIKDRVAEIVRKAKEADIDDPSNFRPGEIQCKYCAAAACGKCKKMTRNLEKFAPSGDVVLKNRIEELPSLPDASLVELYDQVKLLEKLISAVKAELEKRCSEKGEVEGYVIKESSAGQKLEDIPWAFHALKDLVTQDEFLSCCDVRIPALKEIFATKAKTASKVATKKAGESLFGEILGEHLVEKTKRHTLTKK